MRSFGYFVELIFFSLLFSSIATKLLESSDRAVSNDRPGSDLYDFKYSIVSLLAC